MSEAGGAGESPALDEIREGVLRLDDGAQLAWCDVGERGRGAPLVLLHAFPLSRGMWAPQLPALAPHAWCITPDFRGFGRSTLGTFPVTVDRYADDVVALLDHLGAERAVVAGLSMGGYVALALWRRHQARVRALVLADTRAAADGDETRARRRMLIDLAQREGSAAVAEQQLESMLGKTTRETRPAVVRRVRELMEEASPEGIVGALEAMMARPDSTAMLSTITVPTLLLVGEEDAVTQPKEMQAMAGAIPDARIEIVAGAGHASNLERPERFTETVLEFVKKL